MTSIGTAPRHVRSEAEFLAILLWRDFWVAETEVKAQEGAVWKSVDRTLLDLRARPRPLMTEKDRRECDAIIALRPLW